MHSESASDAKQRVNPFGLQYVGYVITDSHFLTSRFLPVDFIREDEFHHARLGSSSRTAHTEFHRLDFGNRTRVKY